MQYTFYAILILSSVNVFYRYLWLSTIQESIEYYQYNLCILQKENELLQMQIPITCLKKAPPSL